MLDHPESFHGPHPGELALQGCLANFGEKRPTSIADLWHNLGEEEWMRLQTCHVPIKHMRGNPEMARAALALAEERAAAESALR